MKDESEKTLQEIWKDMPHDVEPYDPSKRKLSRKEVIEKRRIWAAYWVMLIGGCAFQYFAASIGLYK